MTSNSIMISTVNVLPNKVTNISKTSRLVRHESQPRCDETEDHDGVSAPGPVVRESSLEGHPGCSHKPPMAGPEMYSSRLSKERREIRLLHLEPGSWASPIQCSLTVASLDSVPSYNALSYVWGDPTITADIQLNGLEISVTRNLESALRHVRFAQTDRILWVDALCINQRDAEERSQQVSMMGSIYANASTVLIWIGEADSLSDTAFDSISTIADGYVDDVARKEVCSFYLSLGSRPWFSRVWIIQELALAAQDPVVVCGRKSVLWSLFISAWTVLSTELLEEMGMVRSETPDDNNDSPSIERLASIKIDVLNEIRKSVRSSKGKTLRQLYLYSRSSEATEPRDRVYGLLGMLGEDDIPTFKIDYNKPVSTVFAEAIAHIFEKGEGPYFLAGLWLHSSNLTIPDLPTWVPDLTAQTAEKAGHPGSISFHPPSPMSASGVGAGAKNGEVCEDMRTLKVEVLFVDYVEDVMTFDLNASACLSQLEDVEQLVTKAGDTPLLDGTLTPYWERYRTSEPIWHILLSGKKHMSGYDQAPAEYGQAYAQLLDRDDDPLSDRPESSRASLQCAEELVEEYRRNLANYLPNRTFFTTSKGLVGIGAQGIRAGDHVTIWLGSPVPFVTRPCVGSHADKCTLVGAAYVGGIMNGEMVDELYCEDLLDSQTLFVV